MDEHKRMEQMEESDMARDAMPDLSPRELRDLNKLGK